MDVEESTAKQVIDENIDKFNEKCKERRLRGQTVIRQRQHEKIRIQRNTVNTTKVQHNFQKMGYFQKMKKMSWGMFMALKSKAIAMMKKPMECVVPAVTTVFKDSLRHWILIARN